jgi:hypothetical protein
MESMMNENDTSPEPQEGSDPMTLADEELATASGGKGPSKDSTPLLGEDPVIPIST